MTVTTDPLVGMASKPGIERETAEYGMGFRLKIVYGNENLAN